MGKTILGTLFFLCAANVLAATANDYYNAGLSCYQQGQYDMAVQYFRAVVESQPYHWQAYQYLGSAYAAKGNYADALNAYQQSLQINPNNPALRRYVDQIRPMVPEAVSTGNANAGNTAAAPITHAGVDPFWKEHKVFLQVGAFLGTAMLGDIKNGEAAWKKQNQAGSEGYDTYNANGGFIELGIVIDPWDAISFSYGGMGGGTAEWGYRRNLDNYGKPQDELKQDIQLYCNYAGIDYYRFIPDSAGRWFAKVGIELYSVFGDYSYNLVQGGSTIDTRGADLNGLALGGSFALGRQFRLFGAVGLEISGRAQYANVGQVGGDYRKLSGHKLALAVAPDGSVIGVDQQMIGTNGLRYANIDWSGFEGRAALLFYF
jgi:tetratricopeptide (TPR) repeat protein